MPAVVASRGTAIGCSSLRPLRAMVPVVARRPAPPAVSGAHAMRLWNSPVATSAAASAAAFGPQYQSEQLRLAEGQPAVAAGVAAAAAPAPMDLGVFEALRKCRLVFSCLAFCAVYAFLSWGTAPGAPFASAAMAMGETSASGEATTRAWSFRTGTLRCALAPIGCALARLRSCSSCAVGCWLDRGALCILEGWRHARSPTCPTSMHPTRVAHQHIHLMPPTPYLSYRYAVHRRPDQHRQERLGGPGRGLPAHAVRAGPPGGEQGAADVCVRSVGCTRCPMSPSYAAQTTDRWELACAPLRVEGFSVSTRHGCPDHLAVSR